MLSCLLITAALGAPPVVVVSIRDSIEASLTPVVGDDAPALGNQLARLVRWRGDIVKNVHPNDKLRLLYERAPVPELVAVIYEGTEVRLRAYRFEGADGIGRFYDETGTLIEPKLLFPPVVGYTQITEIVQSGRGKRKHRGLDIKAPEGTPVVMPFDGRVLRVNFGSLRTNGKCIEVLFATDKIGRFLHLHDIEPATIPGAKLARGTRIGAVGSTGRSVAPHLHYEISTHSGGVIDPLKEHGTQTARVDDALRSAFDAQRADLDRKLGFLPPFPENAAAE